MIIKKISISNLLIPKNVVRVLPGRLKWKVRKWPEPCMLLLNTFTMKYPLTCMSRNHEGYYSIVSSLWNVIPARNNCMISVYLTELYMMKVRRKMNAWWKYSNDKSGLNPEMHLMLKNEYICRVFTPKRITLKKYVAQSPEMIWYRGLLIETSAT